jgi:hypothetical protein
MFAEQIILLEWFVRHRHRPAAGGMFQSLCSFLLGGFGIGDGSDRLANGRRGLP